MSHRLLIAVLVALSAAAATTGLLGIWLDSEHWAQTAVLTAGAAVAWGLGTFFGWEDID